MTRPQLEISDIFRHHGQQWREHNQGHINLSQLKIMSAIENCRTEVLGAINFIANHVIRRIFLITHVVIGIVQNAKQAQQKDGLKPDRRNYYLSIIIIWFLPYQKKSQK